MEVIVIMVSRGVYMYLPLSPVAYETAVTKMAEQAAEEMEGGASPFTSHTSLRMKLSADSSYLDRGVLHLLLSLPTSCSLFLTFSSCPLPSALCPLPSPPQTTL